MDFANRLVKLGRKLGVFLAGNAFVQGINLITGLAILWILPIEEYSLYIVCAALITIANVGSDYGFSQALVTLGSKAQGDRKKIAQIFLACGALRKRYLIIINIGVALAGVFIGMRQHWALDSWFAAIALVAIASWLQRRIGPYTGFFNVYQDARAIIRTAYWPGLLRLALTLVVCSRLPYGVVALAINAAGFLLQDFISSRLARRYLTGQPSITEESVEREVSSFARPLLPGVVYYLFQGQIVIFVLTWLGRVESIAEVGALSRLGQAFAILGPLNGFFIQPYFSAITNRNLFRRRLILLIEACVLFAAIIILSTYRFDYLWVLILGSKYVHLQNLIPIAVAGCLLSLFGGLLYFIVISTGNTKYQMLQIPLGIGMQAIVMFFAGIDSTRDAIIVSYAPVLAYFLLQASLLVYFIGKSTGFRGQ